MGVIGWIGLIIGLLALRVAFTRPTGERILLFVLCYAMHVAASVVYWWYFREAGADTNLYYFDPYRRYYDGFALGTQTVIIVTGWLRRTLGGGYLDYFLFYQAFGMVGIALLIRTSQEIYKDFSLPPDLFPYWILFFPSLHFWSSAIGKDAPYLLATSLALWSSARLSERKIGLVISFLLMLALRPHTAVVAAAAFAGAVMFGRNIRGFTRVVLFVIAGGATIAAAVALRSTYEIDIFSPDSISAQYDRFSRAAGSRWGGSTAVQGSYPVLLASLLARPLFFDVVNPMGLLASLENLIIIPILIMLLLNIRTLKRCSGSLCVRYAIWLAAAMTLFLSLSYWNVGLGLRHKWVMLMPAVLVLYVTIRAAARVQREQRRHRGSYVIAHDLTQTWPQSVRPAEPKGQA